MQLVCTQSPDAGISWVDWKRSGQWGEFAYSLWVRDTDLYVAGIHMVFECLRQC